MIVVGHLTVGGEEEDRNNNQVTDFMRNRDMEDQADDRHLWRLGLDPNNKNSYYYYEVFFDDIDNRKKRREGKSGTLGHQILYLKIFSCNIHFYGT